MRRVLLVAVLLMGLGLASCLPQRYFPRMRNQASVRAQERWMPPLPPGVVPHDGGEAPLSRAAARAMRNPAGDDDESAALGATYYAWYCLACHGEDGRGNTQVGAGYLPPPRDLSGDAVQAMTDGELYVAMVEGSGHQVDGRDVLRQTVPPERRWLIARHLRQLGRRGQPSPSGGA